MQSSTQDSFHRKFLSNLLKNGSRSELTQSDSPYSRFMYEELILRDHLAIDRTILANESTFLAFIRTGLALIAGGASLFKFFSEQIMHAAGLGLIIIGLGTLLIGYQRYKKMLKSIHKIKKN